MFIKRRDTRGEKLDTIIGNGAGFSGNLKVEGALRVDGRVDGEINVQGDIIIGKTAFIQAAIKGRNAIVAGEVHGDISLEGKLELDKTGKLFGDIEVAKLVIHEGALFQGNSRMLENGESKGKIERKVKMPEQEKDKKAG